MSRLIKSIPVAADFCQSTLRGSDCYFEGFAFYDDKTVGYRSGLPAYEWYYEEYEDVRFIPAGEQQSYAQIRLLKSVAKEESRTGPLWEYHWLELEFSILFHKEGDVTLSNFVAEDVFSVLRHAFSDAKKQKKTD